MSLVVALLAGQSLVALSAMAPAAPSDGRAEQELQFASLFRGGAVLQRGQPAAVWGSGGNTKVRLFLDGILVADADADSAGKWRAYLPATAAAFNRTLTAMDRTGNSVRTTVSFGDVLLCSGQSNMQMPVGAPGFAAKNGTAETAAAGAYTGKIWFASAQRHVGWNGTFCGPNLPPSCKPEPEWNIVSPETLTYIYAVCWYSGRMLSDHLGGSVPVGLLMGAVGGSPIEAWMQPHEIIPCGADEPPCDIKNNVSHGGFFHAFIEPLQPYTVGAVIWDQGERDAHCYAPATNRTAEYPCMERNLVRSWRRGFNSSFAFIAVQLPGYIGDCDSTFANPKSTFENCVPGVFNMRVAQATGVDGVAAAAVVATYDQSCPFGVKTDVCPFGSVHPLDKVTVGRRVALQLRKLMLREADVVAEGPRATRFETALDGDSGNYTVTVAFGATGHSDGSEEPLQLAPTANCDECCLAGDFDASADGGASWVNGTVASVVGPATVSFSVKLPAAPTAVRYTGNRAFPQCAVYNVQGLPALPFSLQGAAAVAEQVAIVI